MNRYRLFQAGVDVNQALERLGNDRELYEELLVRFKNSTRYADLMSALNADDAEQAFQMAHALKGTAGNLSFNRLFDALLPVVEALRQNDIVLAKASIGEVEDAYQDVINAL